MAESEKLVQLNKKIAELKKRILLAEGQKKANSEEWEKQKRLNSETISNLKKDIKELTTQLTDLKNPVNRRFVKPSQEPYGKPQYPAGAKTAADAVELMDLKVIELKKQHDLLRDRYLKKQRYFNKLVEEYKELLTYKNYKNEDPTGPPPETLEEDANRKLVCHLENEIHRTNVQWMEAEHIRKKYRSIKGSLMNDSERFERSLRELEEALTEQQAEINRLQQVHKEAIEMRDAAKIILQRQEQQANISNRARERQALDFRKQVEERKMELERIERKLFSTGKNLVHQESAGSSSGDQLTGKTEQEDDPNAQLKAMTSEMETTFKKLMEVTGATTAQEVLMRFLSQKESTQRLSYLRTAAEAEKKHLEYQRDLLTSELETSKFANIQDNEVNLEEVERLKSEIAENKRQEQENMEAAERIQKVITTIREILVDMIFKLQEVDETDITASNLKVITAAELPDFLVASFTDEDLINILDWKLSKALKALGPKEVDDSLLEDELLEEVKLDELAVVSPRLPPVFDEKPQPLPICYVHLITGRAGQSSSASPGQTPQPVGSDDENEVPSRNFLKKQAVVIVDAKSRRKGFRPAAKRK